MGGKREGRRGKKEEGGKKEVKERERRGRETIAVWECKNFPTVSLATDYIGTYITH